MRAVTFQAFGRGLFAVSPLVLLAVSPVWGQQTPPAPGSGGSPNTPANPGNNGGQTPPGAGGKNQNGNNGQPPAESPAFPKSDVPAPQNDQAPPTTPGNVQSVSLPSPLSLSQAIGFALRLQPTLAVAVANREAARQREVGARAAYFPTLTPQYTYNSQYTYGTVNQAVGGGLGVVPVQVGRTNDSRSAVIGGVFRLYDSGRRDLSARQSRQERRGSEYGEANTRQTVTANVADNYFTVLRNEALVKVSEAQVARAQNTLDVINAQVGAGVAARKDTYQAQADLLNAQVQLLTAQNNAAIAQANLKNSIGVVGGEPLRLVDLPAPTEQTPPVNPEVAGPPSATPATATGAASPSGAATPATTAPPVGGGVTTPPAKGTPATPAALPVTGTPPGGGIYLFGNAADIDRLVQEAYRNRPDLAQAQANVESAYTSSSIARINTGFAITSDLTATQTFDPTSITSSSNDRRQVNVALTYPLFDGGYVRSQFAAARSQARASEAQLTTQRQQVAVDVENAYRTLTQTRASLPAAAAAQQAAQINYEAALESRREGVGSIVDVITAQTALVTAQTNYVQAIYNFYGADARLARAIGRADRVAQIGAAQGANPGPAPSAPATGTPSTPAGGAPAGTPGANPANAPGQTPGANPAATPGANPNTPAGGGQPGQNPANTPPATPKPAGTPPNGER